MLMSVDSLLDVVDHSRFFHHLHLMYLSRSHPGDSAESAYDDDAMFTEMKTNMIMENVDTAFPNVD